MFYIRYYWILYIYCTSAGIFSLFLFIHKQYESARDWALKEFDPPLELEYDFIVVGGGTAGSLLAGRLAENSNQQILLIEAGGSSSLLHDIPISAPMIQRSAYDWQHKTVPQDNACLGLENKISCWPMGKILGGTSRLNYMVYLRGHEKDYETWANGSHWNFSDILYYFKRSENQYGPFKTDSKYHGTEGPVYVSELSFHTDLVEGLLGAAEELGYPRVDLNNMRSSPGVMQAQVTSFNGARWSSEHALRKRLALRSKKNIRIITNTIVEKVLLKNGYEAYAVVFERNGAKGQVTAKKSIILSAGTVGSAKILLLSGIGPREELLENKIEPLVDLPVGRNLQDHVTTGLDLLVLNYSLPMSSLEILKTPINTYKYYFNGDGVMTHPGCEVVGLFHTENGPVPDLQLMALPAGLSTDAGVVLKSAMCISDKLWEEYFSPLVGQQVATVLPALLHPKSRGFVRLRSADVQDPPIIDPNYLSHRQDVQVLIKGLKLIEKLVSTKAMAKLGAKLYNKKMPGCEHLKFLSEEYWECYVRYLTLTAYHPVGTCKMGWDKDSVVDYDLSVHRTNKLFIIDASIMPTLPSANINAAVMMIAEKGADILKYRWHTHYHKCSLKQIFLQDDITLKGQFM